MSNWAFIACYLKHILTKQKKGSSAYNPISLQRQRELDTSNSPFLTKLKPDDRPTLSMNSSSGFVRGSGTMTNHNGLMRENPSRYANAIGNPSSSSSYSRSNSIVNMNAVSSTNYKSLNSMKFTDEYNTHNNANINGSTTNLRNDEPQPDMIMMMGHSNRRDSTG